MPNKRKDGYSNSLVTPIYQTATYYFENTKEIIDYHDKSIQIGRYGRYDNPSWIETEKKLAELDNFDEALLFPSGMNAIATTLLALTKKGDRILFTGKGYRNIRNLCENILSNHGLEAIPLSPSHTDTFISNLKYFYTKNTKIIFVETPSNPHLYLVDIAKIKSIISSDTLLIVDSTFSTPINFLPKNFGADLVIHSCSKYIGGHADILAGSISGNKKLISIIRNVRNIMGCIIDPHTAFLLNRSIATLNLRMQYYNENGLKTSKYLEEHPKVKKVYYTGLQSHPHYELAKKYLTGHGGVISFELNFSKEQTSYFIDSLKIPFMGTNFGSQHTMIEQCSIFTYYNQSEEERKDLEITDTLIRLSLGFENINSITEDLNTALNLIEPTN